MTIQNSQCIHNKNVTYCIPIIAFAFSNSISTCKSWSCLIFIFLWANDSTMMCIMQIWLQRCLKALPPYCSREHLELNYSKTKVLEFSRICFKAPIRWIISSKCIKQVKSFKCLVLNLQASTCWSSQTRELLVKASTASFVIVKFAAQFDKKLCLTSYYTI